ncbi:MAG: 4a-hydroxytetrahydrobiopterin dehydratase [Phycisphaerae bacterium]
MSELANQSCVPCTGGVPRLDRGSIDGLLAQLDGWAVERGHHLTKTFSFPDFRSALAAVVAIGAIAEAQAHHPDLYLAWGVVRVDLWTHKIDGLTESDFVFAAKVDRALASAT